MNRKQRRAMAAEARATAAAWPEALTEVPRESWPPFPGAQPPVTVWVSRGFIVQLFAFDGAPPRLSIRSTDPRGRHDVTWDELQAVKRDIGFGHMWAIEVYPPDDSVENVAPMRHLWLMPKAMVPDLRFGGVMVDGGRDADRD